MKMKMKMNIHITSFFLLLIPLVASIQPEEGVSSKLVSVITVILPTRSRLPAINSHLPPSTPSHHAGPNCNSSESQSPVTKMPSNLYALSRKTSKRSNLSTFLANSWPRFPKKMTRQQTRISDTTQME